MLGLFCFQSLSLSCCLHGWLCPPRPLLCLWLWLWWGVVLYVLRTVLVAATVCMCMYVCVSVFVLTPGHSMASAWASPPLPATLTPATCMSSLLPSYSLLFTPVFLLWSLVGYLFILILLSGLFPPSTTSNTRTNHCCRPFHFYWIYFYIKESVDNGQVFSVGLKSRASSGPECMWNWNTVQGPPGASEIHMLRYFDSLSATG